MYTMQSTRDVTHPAMAFSQLQTVGDALDEYYGLDFEDLVRCYLSEHLNHFDPHHPPFVTRRLVAFPAASSTARSTRRTLG